MAGAIVLAARGLTKDYSQGESTQRVLAGVDLDQYGRTLWTLANDGSLAADYRLQVAAWLAAESLSLIHI